MKTILSILAAGVIALPCLAWDTIYLNVPPNASESTWRDALAKTLHGQTERIIEWGRIDVETDLYVIEIDFYHKWTECLGQSIFYSESTGKQGVAALIVDDLNKDELKLKMIENLFNKYDIGLVILISKEKGEK